MASGTSTQAAGMVETVCDYESQAADQKLSRRVFAADRDAVPTFGVLVAHGWGDHLGCHRRAAQMFVDRGGLALGVDWPGNGKSSGIRGHLDSVDEGVKILQEELEVLRAELAKRGAENVPVGFYAHSTGCVMGLKFLADCEAGTFEFVWLSSPLARPEAGQSEWKLKTAAWVAKLLPKLPFDTGVRAPRCHRADPETGKYGNNAGCHPLISAQFGKELADLSIRGEVMAWGRALCDPLPLLMTLGAEDTVCPPQYGRELFEVMSLGQKTLIEWPEFRHEPLRDYQWQLALKDVKAWLDKVHVAGRRP